MKFHYSNTGKVVAVQPADGNFYPFPAKAFGEGDFSEQEFIDVDYIGKPSLQELADISPEMVDDGMFDITPGDLIFTTGDTA